MEKSFISGRIWVLLDQNKRLIEDIDTDQIYHNAFLPITEVSQMGQYALGNLEGWKDFRRRPVQETSLSQEGISEPGHPGSTLLAALFP